MNIQSHLRLLGLKVEDKVTGLRGVVTSVCFDLFGCVQATINPGIDKEEKLRDLHWFDVSRLRVLPDAPVMDRPNFEFGPQAEGKQGPSEKPSLSKP